MTRLHFELLCQDIIRYTGEMVFKSEAYIDAFLKKSVKSTKLLARQVVGTSLVR